jgi:magnesium-transporting ATPase (P-type)
VVSPFTSRTRSPESVIDLLKEGRASLATSFANYKFLITYGMQFSVVKLCSFYYGVLMSSMSYYFIDGVALTTICYTMTLSGPLEHLSKQKPTASLLGPGALASTLGVNVVVLACLACALLLMEAEEGYVPWPAQYSAGGDWCVAAVCCVCCAACAVCAVLCCVCCVCYAVLCVLCCVCCVCCAVCAVLCVLCCVCCVCCTVLG